MTFYWVNVGGSFKEVNTHSFLWAPAYSINKHGKKVINAGWKNVPNVKKGDILFCHTDDAIVLLAKATSSAYESDRPPERKYFKWQIDGYRIEVFLNKLDVAIPKTTFLKEFFDLYNDNTTPKLLNKNGGLNEQYMVYISNAGGAFLLDQINNFNPCVDVNNLTNDEQNTSQSTTKNASVSMRVGQDKFRKDVLSLWDNKCAVTDIDVLSLLTASHIHSWQLSNDTERLDKYNGLPLTPDIDKLFDRGLISFSDNGILLKSPKLDASVLEKLGLNESSNLRYIFKPNIHYLKKHRVTHGFFDEVSF